MNKIKINKVEIFEFVTDIGRIRIERHENGLIGACLTVSNVSDWTGRFILPKSMQKRTNEVIIKQLSDFHLGKTNKLN